MNDKKQRDEKGQWIQRNVGGPGRKPKTTSQPPDNDVTRLRLLKELTERTTQQSAAHLELQLLKANEGTHDITDIVKHITQINTHIYVLAHTLLLNELERMANQHTTTPR